MDDNDPAAAAAAPGHIRTLLEEKRADLLGRIEQFGASNPAETSNLNFGKRIGDGTTYAVERMTGAYQARTLYETVKEIDQALGRLEEGSYGLCQSCGTPIPEGRLLALPWAALCIPCSGRAAQGRSRAGPRGE
jgi:DnaK suppressor protein